MALLAPPLLEVLCALGLAGLQGRLGSALLTSQHTCHSVSCKSLGISPCQCGVIEEIIPQHSDWNRCLPEGRPAYIL